MIMENIATERDASDIHRSNNIFEDPEGPAFRNAGETVSNLPKTEGESGPYEQTSGPGRIRTCDHLVSPRIRVSSQRI